MKMSCPECEALRDVNLVERVQTLKMKGIAIKFQAKSYRCDFCEEEFDTAESLDENLNSARMEYWKQPSQITISKSLKAAIDKLKTKED